MKGRAKRFQRLELLPVLKIFRKPNIELKRFERLEVEGHKIKIKITKEIEKGYISCPKCQRNNPKGSLYCLYCSYVFESIAKEEKVDFKPWEIRCPGCGRINNRNQKYCIYCGWRITPFEKEELGIEPEILRKREEEALFTQGEIITLTVDGKTYHSTDKIIPLDVKELMLRIKREGYSKEMVDEWVKSRNLVIELKKEEIDQRISELRWQVFWRVLGVVGFILLIIIYFWLRVSIWR